MPPWCLVPATCPTLLYTHHTRTRCDVLQQWTPLARCWRPHCCCLRLTLLSVSVPDHTVTHWHSFCKACTDVCGLIHVASTCGYAFCAHLLQCPVCALSCFCRAYTYIAKPL